MPELRESVSTIRLGEELEDLSRELARVLPADAPVDYSSAFDADEYAGLCRKVETCLALRRGLVEREFQSSSRVQMRANDLFQRLERELVKRMIRAVIETIPAPEITASDGMVRKMTARKAAGSVVRLYQLITGNAAVLTGQPASEWWQADLSRRVSHMIEFHQEQITKMLRSDDPPDVRSLATDLLRMDVLHMVLRDLRLDTAATTVSSNLMVTARMTLQASSDAIERYVKRRDEFTRFDVAIVITAVDDLIAVVERVLEGDREAESRNDLIHELGGETIGRFVRNMGVLMLAIFEDLNRAATEGTLSAGHFERHLATIEHVFEFCVHVNPTLKGDPLKAASKVVRTRSGDLVNSLTAWAGKQDGAQAQNCLKHMQQFLTRLPLG